MENRLLRNMSSSEARTPSGFRNSPSWLGHLMDSQQQLVFLKCPFHKNTWKYLYKPWPQATNATLCILSPCHSPLEGLAHSQTMPLLLSPCHKWGSDSAELTAAWPDTFIYLKEAYLLILIHPYIFGVFPLLKKTLKQILMQLDQMHFRNLAVWAVLSWYL